MQIDPGQYHRQSISDHAMAKWKEKHNGGIFEEGPAQAPSLPSLAPCTVGLRPRSLVPSPPCHASALSLSPSLPARTTIRGRPAWDRSCGVHARLRAPRMPVVMQAHVAGGCGAEAKGGYA